MDGRPVPRGPGKSAPRLLNDLLDHDPRYYGRNGRNLLADPAPIFRGAALLRKGPHDCRHQLIKKLDQTQAPDSNDEIPTSETRYVVATYCGICQYHFEIIVDFTQGRGATPCRLKDAKNPMHHLRPVSSWIQKRDGKPPNWNKYKPIIESHRFICSASSCPASVEIKISLPRLPTSLLSTIINAATLKARGVRIIAEEPERYDGQSPLQPLQVLLNIRAYLVDAKAGSNGGELKKIAKRNKKFCLAFADECDDLLHYLDFKPFTEVADPPFEPSHFWQLPIVTDENSVFIDDTLAEIDLLIAKRPPAEQEILKNKITHTPLAASQDITRSLGCFDYPTRSRHVDLTIEPHPHYASLGALDNFTDELLLWAYDRQCECDPRNKPYYLDCLAGLADGRSSGDLQTRQAIAESGGELRLSQIEAAYRFFALDPNREHNEETVIGTYRSRIESAPLQREEARKCLDILGRAKDSEKIRYVANDKTMSLKEAFEFLELPETVDDEMIEAATVGLVQDKDKTRVAAAVRLIAKQRGGLFLYDVANHADPEYIMNNQEAYLTLQIGNRALSDELVFEYYKQQTIDATPTVHERASKALYSIATHRRSELLFAKMANPDAVVHTPNEPVGLDNIGNTCYLNSLLQFYYTIGAVREVVTNIDKYRMDLNNPRIDEDIMKKQVGGRKIKRFEISKAQKFVDELHNLFEALRTAPTKSVRPSNQLAELTLFSDAAEADYRKKSISSPNGPPNLSILHPDDPVFGPVFGPEGPLIPQHATSPVDDDIEMVDRPTDKNMGNGSDTSESTLVDMVESFPSNNDASGKAGSLNAPREKNPVDTELIGLDDAVMINGEDISPGTEKKSLDLGKPMLPPRKNKNLSIQTDNTRTNNDMLTFGAQQDVTEVIGNVVWRLSCAIKPTSFDPTSGEQIDMIRDTFYGANAVYTEKASNPERKVESWAQLIIFPHASKPRDIYEALDVVFDEQTVFVENDNTPQYTSITQLPPILQIHIQRTDFDNVKKVSFKNRNPVSIPETIYMDRYMDSDDPNLLRRRREAWKWKARLRTLEARKTALEETDINITVPDALLATRKFLVDLQAAGIEGLEVDSALIDAVDERRDEVAHELERLSTEIIALKQKISEQFMDLTKYEYKLQTIFIHRGESGGGHYWIYLYDFESATWREYNDDHVSIVKDHNTIFNPESSQSGTPYYLAYVRSADRENLVNAVVRDVKEPEPEVIDVSEGWNGQQDEGIAMIDVEDGEEPRHVENANVSVKAPRPILPRPAQPAAWDSAWGANPQGTEFDANGRRW